MGEYRDEKNVHKWSECEEWGYPIHLVVEAIGAKFGGAAAVLLEVVNAALVCPDITRITVFCSSRPEREFDFPISEKVRLIQWPLVSANYLVRLLWYEFGLRFACRAVGADVLLVSANFGRGGFGIPQVTCVQQSLPFSQEASSAHTSLRTRIQIYFYRWQMRRSCLSAKRVICQSSVMQRAIRQLTGISSDKVVAIYSAPKNLEVAERPSPQLKGMRSESRRHRLLYVGSDAPYKKLDTLTKAVRLIRDQLPSAGAFLTLPSPHVYAADPGVTCVGYLDGAALTEAYELADVLVLPSLVESGPQPLVEAMSLGTPVLVADRPYAHDICEDAAVFFDPHSPEDLADKAIQLLSDEGLRQSLIAKSLALVERRRAAKPYQRLVDILIEAANSRK